MIEWKYEKKLIDYRFAEEAMSKRVESIISNHETELIWCLEHHNIYTLGTSAKTSDFKYEASIPSIRLKGVDKPPITVPVNELSIFCLI